jgi:hypothetical protein
MAYVHKSRLVDSEVPNAGDVTKGDILANLLRKFKCKYNYFKKAGVRSAAKPISFLYLSLTSLSSQDLAIVRQHFSTSLIQIMQFSLLFTFV